MSQDIEKPNYYSITPASVRYDKKLKPLARLLYGEITALCNQEGYCWAKNSYFALLYEVDERSVTRWIRDLEKRNYIKIKMEYKNNSKEIKRRLIYIADPLIIQNLKDGGDKNVTTPPDSEVIPPPDKNVTTPGDNNVIIGGDKNVGDNNKLSLDNINNFTNKKLDEVIILFFETGWKNWKSYKMNKGDLKKAKKNFEKIVSDKSNPTHPMHLVLAMESYCSYCTENEIKTGHVATFLNGPHLEYLEKVAEKLEAEKKSVQIENEEKTTIKEFNDDPFWINAKEMLLKSPEIPQNWKDAILNGGRYFGIDIEGSHVISVNSKFFRDWISREYKNTFEKIFTKWQIIYYK